MTPAISKRVKRRALKVHLRSVLTDVIEPYHARLVREQRAALLDILAKVKDAQLRCGSYAPYAMFKGNVKRQKMCFKVVQQRGTDWELLEDVESKIDLTAKLVGTMFMGTFVHRTLQNLLSVAAKKDFATDVEIVNETDGQWISFNFEDGAKFQVLAYAERMPSADVAWRTKCVTRFKNVVLSNGTEMAEPSMAKMKKEFT